MIRSLRIHYPKNIHVSCMERVDKDTNIRREHPFSLESVVMDIPGQDFLTAHMDRETQETPSNPLHLDEGYRTAVSTQVKKSSLAKEHECSKELRSVISGDITNPGVMSDSTESNPGIVVRNTQVNNSQSIMVDHDTKLGRLQVGSVGDHSTQDSGGSLLEIHRRISHEYKPEHEIYMCQDTARGGPQVGGLDTGHRNTQSPGGSQQVFVTNMQEKGFNRGDSGGQNTVGGLLQTVLVGHSTQMGGSRHGVSINNIEELGGNQGNLGRQYTVGGLLQAASVGQSTQLQELCSANMCGIEGNQSVDVKNNKTSHDIPHDVCHEDRPL